MEKNAMTPLWTFWQCAILDGNIPADTAWRALQASAQDPNPEDVTSNTRWSLVYDDTALTAQIALRRNWDDVIHYDLNTNTIGG